MPPFCSHRYAFGILLAFVPDRAAAAGMRSSLAIAVLPSSSAIAISIVAPNMGRLSKRLGERGVAALAMLAYAGGCGAFLLARGFPALEAGALLLGIGHGLLFPLSQVMLARALPHGRSILLLSFTITAMGIAQTLAPLLMSWVYGAAGLNAVFLTAMAVAAVLLPFAWLLPRLAGHAETPAAAAPVP